MKEWLFSREAVFKGSSLFPRGIQTEVSYTTDTSMLIISKWIKPRLKWLFMKFSKPWNISQNLFQKSPPIPCSPFCMCLSERTSKSLFSQCDPVPELTSWSSSSAPSRCEQPKCLRTSLCTAMTASITRWSSSFWVSYTYGQTFTGQT